MSSPAVGVSKRDILIFPFKWKGTLVGWSMFTVFMVTLLTYLLPQVYPASTNVVIERNRAPTLRSTYTPDGLESIEAMNNEVAIIRSRAVMAAVVEDLEDMVTRDPHLQRHLVPVQGDGDDFTFLTHAQPARTDGELPSIRRSPLLGEHNVRNALAAIAARLVVGALLGRLRLG